MLKLLQNNAPGTPDKTSKSQISPITDQLDQIPPDFKKCRTHREAWMVKNLQSLEELEDWKNPNKFCQCCHLPLNTAAKKFSFWADPSEISVLGLGFSLFYKMKIFHFVLYLTFCIVVSIMAILTYLDSDGSAEEYNSTKSASFLASISLGNYGKNISEDEESHLNSLKNVHFLFILLFITEAVIYQIYEMAVIKDREKLHTKASDFCVVATNIPKNRKEDEIMKWVKELDPSFSPVYVNLCYDIQDPVQNIRKIEKLRNRRRGLELYKEKILSNRIKEGGPNQIHPPPKKFLCCSIKRYGEIDDEINSISKKIEELADKNKDYELDSKRLKEHCGTAFIVFDETKNVQDITNTFRISYYIRVLYFILHKIFKCRRFCVKEKTLLGDKRIFIEKAAEPNDYIWENLSSRMRVRVVKTAKTYGLASICLVCSFCVNLLLSTIRDQLAEDKQSNIFSEILMFLLLILTTLFVACTNIGLGRIIRTISLNEHHHTTSGYHLSVAIKLTIATFLNTGISPLLVNYGSSNWFHTNGLVVDVFWNTFSVCFVSPLFYLFDPVYLNKIYTMKSQEKKGKDCLLTQRQANTLFEGPPVDMAQRYSNTMLLLSLVMMYSYIFPIIPALAACGITFQYCIEKYLLLNRHKLPVEIGPSLSEFFVGAMPLFICIYAFSIYCFGIILTDQNNYSFPIIASVSLLFYLSPIFDWIKRWYHEYERGDAKNYSENRLKLFSDYDRANPVTRKDAVESLSISRKIKRQTTLKTPRGITKKSTKNIFHHVLNQQSREARNRTRIEEIYNYANQDSHFGEGFYGLSQYNPNYMRQFHERYENVSTQVKVTQNNFPTLVPEHRSDARIPRLMHGNTLNSIYEDELSPANMLNNGQTPNMRGLSSTHREGSLDSSADPLNSIRIEKINVSSARNGFGQAYKTILPKIKE